MRRSLKNLDRMDQQGLTTRKPGLKYRKFRENLPLSLGTLPDYDLQTDAPS